MKEQGCPAITQLLEQLRKKDQPETVALLRRKVTIKKVHFLGATVSGIYPRFIQWYGDSVTETILGYGRGTSWGYDPAEPESDSIIVKNLDRLAGCDIESAGKFDDLAIIRVIKLIGRSRCGKAEVGIQVSRELQSIFHTRRHSRRAAP